MKRAFLLIPILLLSACTADGGGGGSAPGGGALSDQPDYSAIRGTARIVSIDQSLGSAVLDYNGRQINAYWQTEYTKAHLEGALVQKDSIRPPVGIYREAQTSATAFQAKPGDTIQFLALRTGNSLLIQAISVLP